MYSEIWTFLLWVPIHVPGRESYWNHLSNSRIRGKNFQCVRYKAIDWSFHALYLFIMVWLANSGRQLSLLKISWGCKNKTAAFFRLNFESISVDSWSIIVTSCRKFARSLKNFKKIPNKNDINRGVEENSCVQCEAIHQRHKARGDKVCKRSL